MTNADKILSFHFNLEFDVSLPHDAEVMHPFRDCETRRICDLFYHKFYSDNNPRYCIIGINPGRFGGGVTGIPFTDPIRLQKACGIDNTWAARQELSSVYVYDMINSYGGPEAFYQKFYFTAVSPLGFTKHGKNLNYYDDKKLIESIKPFAADCLRKQLSWGFNSSVAFCLGEGANYKFLLKFNKEHRFFNEIVPLSHPRFIMQYRLKTKDVFIDKYLEAFAGL